MRFTCIEFQFLTFGLPIHTNVIPEIDNYTKEKATATRKVRKGLDNSKESDLSLKKKVLISITTLKKHKRLKAQEIVEEAVTSAIQAGEESGSQARRYIK